MRRSCRIALSITAIVLCAVFLALWGVGWSGETFSSASFHGTFAHIIDPNQYDHLAKALLEGHAYLDLNVSPELAGLENPYDFMARYELATVNGDEIYWDYAFYEGRYYSYFGVIPAVLLFVPFRLITGQALATPVAVAILGLCAILGMAFLVASIARRYFARTVTAPTAVLALLMLFGGSNVVYLGMVPRFYSVPILASMAFTFLGIGCWMRAGIRGEDELASGELHAAAPRHATVGFDDVPAGAGPRVPMILLGSLLMAANFGCRPQFMLACFLAFPIFWREITRERSLFSSSSVGASLAALLPFVVVIAPLLAYNYLRFGSPFDMGSHYNLTGFDMTTYRQSIYQTVYLMFGYLFVPVLSTGEFPFLMVEDFGYFLQLVGPGGDWALRIAMLLLAGCAALSFALLVSRMRSSYRGATLVLTAVVLAVCGYVTFRYFTAADRAALLGFAPVEPTFGGVVWIVPYLLLMLLVPLVLDILREKGVSVMCAMCVIFAAIVLVLDIRMAGITQRYLSDFVWYLVLICIFVLFSVQERAQAGEGEGLYRVAFAFVSVALAVSAVTGFLMFVSPLRYDSVNWTNPEFYAAVANMFAGPMPALSHVLEGMTALAPLAVLVAFGLGRGSASSGATGTRPGISA